MATVFPDVPAATAESPVKQLSPRREYPGALEQQDVELRHVASALWHLAGLWFDLHVGWDHVESVVPASTG